MKSYIQILLFSLIMSCSDNTNQNTGFSITAAPLENNEYNQKINLVITNTSGKENSFVIMSCSYNDNFMLSDKDLNILPIECNKNFPTEIVLAPNQSKSYQLTISKKQKIENKNYKIGLKVIQIERKGNPLQEYEQKMKDPNAEIIWSNSLSIK